MVTCNCSRKRFLLAFGVMLTLFSGGGAAASKGPMATIRTSNEAILQIYASAGTAGNDALQRIFTVMDGVTDYNAIAGRAVQSVCPDPEKEVCRLIRREFIESLKLSATRKLGRYRADRFEYITEEVKDGVGYVKTIAHFKEDAVQLEYCLEDRGGEWRIVNYIVDEVDTVRNYQRQFKRIAKKESLSALLARLRKKNDQYRQE